MTEPPILPLVDPFWLSTHLRDPRIIVLDATFPLSEAESTGIAFHALHIPGARWLDFRRVSRKRHPVPRWISSTAEVARAMSDLGVRREMHVVIYDQHGLSMGASRAWWLFHLFGHDRVSVLDGGLTAWLAADLPVESGAAAETTFRPGSKSCRSLGDRRCSAPADKWQQHCTVVLHWSLTCARARISLATLLKYCLTFQPDTFPASINLPFSDLLDGTSARLLPADRLRARLSAAGALDRSVIAMCGVGVVACTLSLAYAALGEAPAPVYDGSWADWVQSGGAGA